jgi:hypothetical protein
MRGWMRWPGAAARDGAWLPGVLIYPTVLQDSVL